MIAAALINPADPPDRQREKLLLIAEALMRRVEQATDDSGAAWAQFQRAAMLEDQVRERTRDLERAMDLLNESNAQLAGAKRAAEAAQANLKNAIETVQEGFALFGADDMLILANARFCDGLPDVRPALAQGLTFADYVAAVARSAHLALPSGETPAEWAATRLARHRDRHVVFNVALAGDRVIQVSEHRTADGGTVILQTDVTEIVRAERAARGKLIDDQARVIRATLDHIAQGVGIFDAGARLAGWNDKLAALLSLPVARLRVGVGADTLTGPLLPDIDRPDAVAAWLAAGGVRPPIRFEVTRGARVLDAFAEGMSDGGFVLSVMDVTAERAARAALARANETLEARVAARTLELEDALAQAERANAARSRFVAAASHDLLQPLSAAKLFLASIGDGALPAPAAEALAKAQNALGSVEALVAALLDISRLESGKAAVSVGPVRLDALLTQLADEFTPAAAARGLRLTVRPRPVAVLSDATYLRRILQNLIANAIRYTERGRVLVGLRGAGPGAVRIEVHDTGPGIPPEEQEAVFREFHRVAARASAAEGMGLGLAIVDRAAALLGHPLTLRSDVGRGTTFALRVPLAPAPATAVATASPAPRPALDRLGLLVENDDDLRRALCLLLERWGVSVLDAATGEAALALIEEVGVVPDFVLADQALGPGMDGLAFLAAFTARHGPLPARIITADRGAALAAACAAAGVAPLYKPIDAAALDAFVTRGV
jgi:signal transduction histidine kinase